MKTKTGKCVDCGYSGPLIAGRCQRCYWPHRKKVKEQGKPKQGVLKRSKRIKPISKGLARMKGKYLLVRAETLSERKHCEARVPGCTIRATEIHHMKGRIGSLLTDKRYFLAVCRNCHNYIEMNPLWAKEKGFSLSRLKKD